MGDGGLCVGAAALILKEKNYKRFKLDNMYLGPTINSKEIKKLSKKFPVKKIKIKKYL